MKLLLDTNTFIRVLSDDRIPRAAQRELERRNSERFLSIVSGWEIVAKRTLGLSANDVETGVLAMETTLLPIKLKHLAELYDLPYRSDHKDPFDRMIIAQALAEDMLVISSDSRFEKYKGLRVVWD